MKIDLDSVNDLVTEQDVEGFIADGAPADEYEGEVEELFSALLALPEEEATSERIVGILKQTWQKNFSLSDAELDRRGLGLEKIAERILHFFG
ncbi:MAG TPA: hypothetical protein VNW54_02300 [Granulicella sp.]|jgi:hypothetical protein|nr:hypothetical protein [Granulicella sp.]